MPRKEIDYSKSVIYKLVCKDVDVKECYVGSTARLIERKSKHRSDCNNVRSKGYKCHVYGFIRQNGGFENWSMILIENYPCENKLELRIRENHHYDLIKPELNSIRAYSTAQLYYQTNNEKIKKQNYEYKQKNKEKMKKYNCEYKQNNKEKINQKRRELYHKKKQQQQIIQP